MLYCVCQLSTREIVAVASALEWRRYHHVQLCFSSPIVAKEHLQCADVPTSNSQSPVNVLFHVLSVVTTFVRLILDYTTPVCIMTKQL